MKFGEMQALRDFFLFFSGSRLGQTRGPILASDTSKRVFWHKKVLFGFRKINISVFTPKIAKNPNFGALSTHFLWKTKMLITFEAKSDHYEIWHAESKTNPQKCSMLKNNVENARWPQAVNVLI